MLYDPKRWPMPEVKPKAPKVEPWQKLLLEAANLIERKGWCKDSYHDSLGRYCAIGALNMVSGLLPQMSVIAGVMNVKGFSVSLPRREAEAKLKMYLHIRGPVENWNDKKGMNGANVIKALRAAAKL